MKKQIIYMLTENEWDTCNQDSVYEFREDAQRRVDELNKWAAGRWIVEAISYYTRTEEEIK